MGQEDKNKSKENGNNINGIYEIKKTFGSGYKIPASTDYIIPYILFTTKISKDGCVCRKVEAKIHLLNKAENEFQWFIPYLSDKRKLKGLTVRIGDLPIPYAISWVDSVDKGKTARITAKMPSSQKDEIILFTLEYYISNYMELIKRRWIYSSWRYSFSYKAMRPTFKLETRIYLPSDYKLVKFQSSQPIEHVELRFQDELIVIWEKDGLETQAELSGVVEYNHFNSITVPIITLISGILITALVGFVARVPFLNLVYLSLIIGVCSAVIIMISLLFIRRTYY